MQCTELPSFCLLPCASCDLLRGSLPFPLPLTGFPGHLCARCAPPHPFPLSVPTHPHPLVTHCPSPPHPLVPTCVCHIHGQTGTMPAAPPIPACPSVSSLLRTHCAPLPLYTMVCYAVPRAKHAPLLSHFPFWRCPSWFLPLVTGSKCLPLPPPNLSLRTGLANMVSRTLPRLHSYRCATNLPTFLQHMGRDGWRAYHLHTTRPHPAPHCLQLPRQHHYTCLH